MTHDSSLAKLTASGCRGHSAPFDGATPEYRWAIARSIQALAERRGIPAGANR